MEATAMPHIAMIIASHLGEEIAGEPLKLDQMGMTHFSFTVPNAEVLLDELLAKGVKLAGPREALFILPKE